MRLIDADELKSVFAEKSTEAVCGTDLCKAIISRIDDTPTVDIPTVGESVGALPVRHGKWIDRMENDDHYVYCSECGDEYIENDLRLNSWVKKYFKYCPNCGARMDKE